MSTPPGHFCTKFTTITPRPLPPPHHQYSSHHYIFYCTTPTPPHALLRFIKSHFQPFCSKIRIIPTYPEILKIEHVYCPLGSLITTICFKTRYSGSSGKKANPSSKIAEKNANYSPCDVLAVALSCRHPSPTP